MTVSLTPSSSAFVSVPPFSGGLPHLAVASPSAVEATISWTAVALVVGSILLLVRPAGTRAVRDELSTRPTIAFAVGFLVWFGVLIGSSLPVIGGTMLGSTVLTQLGLLIALPGLFACAALIVVGGCFGLLTAGEHLSGRLGIVSPSPWAALAVGTAVFGTSQLVPILGAFVTIGLALVGIGAGVLVRWGDSSRIETVLSEPAAEDVAPRPRSRYPSAERSRGRGAEDATRLRSLHRGESESETGAEREAAAVWNETESGTWIETGFRTDETADRRSGFGSDDDTDERDG